MPFQAAFIKDPGVSVNRVIWSPDGALFGVAYLRHIVQIYSYHGGDEVRQHLEIDAHVSGVNDLAFSHPNKQLCVITCGDDNTIKFGMLLLEQNSIPLKVIRLQFILLVHIIKKTFRVFCVKFSGDESYVISGRDDTNLRIWKAKESKQLGVFSCFLYYLDLSEVINV
ncbi:protein TPR3-like isoform X3 [Vigna radiata var. radiata]|uniref:Protein TPR3-like isoform X3 n=1 Tax=Vigna radiata var. radiata TaxID=3916 RepID=A0A3Q0ELJ0_VIGRR|nr:protein TPR3-like isoform X3 [Vigna radiata var. radiata]XP_022632524.1 protein TPR3-like isoform X3 [Vigna radiata var. radiata]XP_022632525.1 protein TPR3-like isoform X3 [Vigna radiata var. radiata]XP_022632526.1 protein TPR3-like isoform X3 [Vigna radiata var. radiata]